jgi:hypothetical protein
MDREEIELQIAEARDKMIEAIWPSERMEYAHIIAALEQELEVIKAEPGE